MIRDLGSGFKVTYELRDDGWHQVRIYRYGRKLTENVFAPAEEDKALKVFTSLKREEIMRTMRIG